MSEPLAFLVTVSAYGTRLHGDPRGTALRRWNADFEASPEPANEVRMATERAAMKNPSPYFSDGHRLAIAESLDEVCEHRGWTLHARNVRTNHVHVVVTANASAEFVMNSFKVWATRRLRAEGLAGAGEKIWARHGSTRYLWDEQDVIDAVTYVLEGQGVDLT